MAQDRPPRPGELRAFWRWMLIHPAIGLIGARELAAYGLPTFSHWRRTEEDRRLIRDNLGFVYIRNGE